MMKRFIAMLLTVGILMSGCFLFASCNTMKPNNSESMSETTVPTTASTTQKAEEPKEPPVTLKILSQNVRYCDDDEGTVEERSLRFEALVSDHLPDIIGVQEATNKWVQRLKQLDGYAFVGVSRNGESSTSGEWSAILFREDRFTLRDSGTFWLTPTPDKVSTTSGANCRRICTWAELVDKQTGKTLIMANTHLDHANDAVRTEQAIYLFIHLKVKLGDRYAQCPVYLTGDFNCVKGSAPYKHIVKEMGFTDSHSAAKKDLSTVKGSYHGYSNLDREIDFCFFKGADRVLTYEIISKDYAGEGESTPGFVSDHYGVMATFVSTE